MKLNYKMFGEGKPVIILHGIFGMLDNWQTFAKLLATDYWVIILDLRNHGKSPHSEDFNYNLMTEDIIEFIDEHHLRNPIIIGHSMGGKLAMHLALEHHDTIQKLIILDIGIKKYSRKHDFIFNALCGLNLEKYKNRSEIDFEIKKIITNQSIRQFILKNIHRNKQNEFSWKMNLKVIKENYDIINDEIISDCTFENDTLFIKGENSDYITDGDKKDIIKLFPKAKFSTIENAGHWLHSEQETKLLEIVKQFI